MLVRLHDVPIEGEEGKFNLGVNLEIITQEENPSE
jgi:hypothetical protein